MAVIGVVGVMSFFIFAVCFFLRRPGKMPTVLVSQLRDFKINAVPSKPKVLEQASFRVLKKGIKCKKTSSVLTHVISVASPFEEKQQKGEFNAGDFLCLAYISSQCLV